MQKYENIYCRERFITVPPYRALFPCPPALGNDPRVVPLNEVSLPWSMTRRKPKATGPKRNDIIMSEGTPIKLHITSSQTDSQGTVDNTEFYTEGFYYEKQDNKYLSYEESAVSGMEGTSTTLELGGKETALTRCGAINSKMIFRLGCETKSIYTTVYGVFDLSILTQKLDIKICNALVDSVYLKYRLRISFGEVYTTEMTIRVIYAY